MSPRITAWLYGLGGVAALALLLWPRKAKAMPASATAFAQAIPPEARPYAAIYLQAAKERSLDPHLLVAIAMRESRSGQALSPPGPAGKGDYGHGHGIMQIDDRSFGPWLRANPWQDSLTNIRKGADIFKVKVKFLQSREQVPGLAEGGLVTVSSAVAQKLGVTMGKFSDPRPLTGDLLIRAALAAYNAGEGSVLQAVAAGKNPDLLTANANYASDVLARTSTIQARALV